MNGSNVSLLLQHEFLSIAALIEPRIHHNKSHYCLPFVRELQQRQLTVHDESPFVLHGAVGDEWVLGSTSQILAVVIDNGNECQNAQ
jgi:hypothetical protein